MLLDPIPSKSSEQLCAATFHLAQKNILMAYSSQWGAINRSVQNSIFSKRTQGGNGSNCHPFVQEGVPFN